MPPVWFAWMDLPNQVRIPFSSLKSAPDAKAKDRLFLVKEEREPVDHLIFASVGIISINQAKRHVKNRHLNAKFGADTAADIGELVKKALVEPNYCVALGFAAQKDLLEPGRQSRQRINRPQSLLGLQQLVAGNQTVVTGHQSEPRGHRQVGEALAGRKCVQGYRRNSARGSGARNQSGEDLSKLIVGQELTRETLHGVGTKIE